MSTWFPHRWRRFRKSPRPTPAGWLRFRPAVTDLETRAVPATLYFDPTASDLGNGMAYFNFSLPGQHMGPFNPLVAVDGAVYSSLDRAVAGAAQLPGRDTIRIAIGNITMTNNPPNPNNNNGEFSGDTNDPGPIDTDGVDVVGSGVGLTILKPNYDSSGPFAFGGVLNFYGNASYSLSNLTIDAIGRNFSTGVAVNDPGTTLTITNVEFKNIRYPTGGTQFGSAVNVQGGACVTVQNSTFSGIGRIGVSGRDPGTVLNVFGSTYTGKGAGPGLDYFVSVIDGATALITGNRVTNNTGVNGTFRSAAVFIGDSPDPGGPASAQIYSNSFGLLANGTVAANDSGVIVGYGAGDFSTADVRFNNIVGTFGITANLNSLANDIIAYYNYWGSPNGPTAASNPGGTGAQATNNVDIGPIRGGPITPTVGANLTQILSSMNPIGPLLSVGPGEGSASNGVVTTLALTAQGSFNALPGQTFGQRVTTADVNGDGVNDIIVASGPGTPGLITVFDGKTQAQLYQFTGMDGFAGGLYVAAADFNRDGFAEIVVVPDVGGGPRVQIFDLSTGTPIQIQSFFSHYDTLRTGLTVSVGDLNGDRIPDIAVVAGPGGGPHAVFLNGAEVFSGSPPSKLFADQFVTDENLRTGYFIALGDVNGDGIADILVSKNTGGNTIVQIWDGVQMSVNNAVSLFNVTTNPGDNGEFTTGVHIAAVDLNGDARADLIAADAANGSFLRVFFANTTSLATSIADATVDLLNINFGVYVG